MSRTAATLTLILAVLLSTAASAPAQMFGDRQLGGFLSRRNSPGALNNPAEALINSGGMLSGNERFLRSNRGVNSFVGMQDRAGFVGVTQARERRTAPAADSLRERRRPDVNRTLLSEQATRDGIYAPRLVLSPGISGPTTTEVTAAVAEHLERAPLEWIRPPAVTMQGRTAILQGEVASPRDRELAEALVRLEPGVSDVQNDLQIARPDSRPSPPEPRLERVPRSRLVPPQQPQELPREF